MLTVNLYDVMSLDQLTEKEITGTGMPNGKNETQDWTD